jgi:hypothetical protein
MNMKYTQYHCETLGEAYCPPAGPPFFCHSLSACPYPTQQTHQADGKEGNTFSYQLQQKWSQQTIF